MFIFSNLAISLDGKIATRTHEYFNLGTSYDRKNMQVLRKRADAILIGGSTLRTYQRPLRVTCSKFQPMNVLVSRGLSGIDPEWAFFKTLGLKRVIFLIQRPRSNVIKKLRDSSQIIYLKKNLRSPTAASQIIKELKLLGVQRLLIEGGGELMWEFVSQNLIDEYHVTLTPLLIGGANAPTLVGGKGFVVKEVLDLKLLKLKRRGNEIFLIYRKNFRRNPHFPSSNQTGFAPKIRAP